ncbi:MAG: methyltransferase domain-containing protein [Desulfobulbaceae bacterium]|nr:methyltransferase domain-containing protein [Desulfobulbaceae bacterium]
MENVLHREFWNGHIVEIRDRGEFRSLYFGKNHLQSRMSITAPHELVLSYTHFMALPLLLNRAPLKILLIGVGSGSLVRFYHHFFPACSIVAVDYSQHVLDLAKGYFQLPDSQSVKVICADGYDYMQQLGAEEFDIILVDAFDGTGMAPAIYRESFFHMCEQSLKPAGVASFNMWSSNKTRFAEIRLELTAAFAGCLFLPVPDRGNVVALTTKTPLPWKTFYSSKKELCLLARRYNLDFNKMVKIAKQDNLTITEKVKRVFL